MHHVVAECNHVAPGRPLSQEAGGCRPYFVSHARETLAEQVPGHVEARRRHEPAEDALPFLAGPPGPYLRNQGALFHDTVGKDGRIDRNYLPHELLFEHDLDFLLRRQEWKSRLLQYFFLLFHPLLAHAKAHRFRRFRERVFRSFLQAFRHGLNLEINAFRFGGARRDSRCSDEAHRLALLAGKGAECLFNSLRVDAFAHAFLLEEGEQGFDGEIRAGLVRHDRHARFEALLVDFERQISLDDHGLSLAHKNMKPQSLLQVLAGETPVRKARYS